MTQEEGDDDDDDDGPDAGSCSVSDDCTDRTMMRLTWISTIIKDKIPSLSLSLI